MSASTYTDIPICNVGFEFRVLLLLKSSRLGNTLLPPPKFSVFFF